LFQYEHGGRNNVQVFISVDSKHVFIWISSEDSLFFKKNTVVENSPRKKTAAVA
jgi:hypothetical protein